MTSLKDCTNYQITKDYIFFVPFSSISKLMLFCFGRFMDRLFFISLACEFAHIIDIATSLTGVSDKSVLGSYGPCMRPQYR